MTWRGRLDGEPMDLITLAETFPDGDPNVLELDGAHWLASNAFVGVGDDANRIDFEKAKALLQRMNGVTRVIDGSYNPVSLTGVFENAQGGVLIAPVQAFGTLTIFGRGRLNVGGPARGDRFLAQVEHDADLDDAFRILGRPLRLLTWGDLYRVYEIVTNALGGKRAGEKRIVDAGWQRRPNSTVSVYLPIIQTLAVTTRGTRACPARRPRRRRCLATTLSGWYCTSPGCWRR